MRSRGIQQRGMGRSANRWMAKHPTTATIRAEQVDQAIKVECGQRILLDADLARLYGVSSGGGGGGHT